MPLRIFQLFKPTEHDRLAALSATAEAAAKAGDSKQAIDLYDEIIRLRPEQAAPYYQRGNLQKNCGQWEAALASYDGAVACDPAHAKAWCNRGVVLEQLQRLAAAGDSYERALAHNPQDALAYYNRAAVLRKLGRTEESLASYDRALAIEPGFVAAHCNRGMLLAELQRSAEAAASYERAIEIDPHFSPAYFYRGALLHERRESAAALASYDRAIELNPDYAEAHSNRGVLLTEQQQWSAALASLERAIALRPEFAEAYSNRGNLFAQLKRNDAALADFDRAVALDSGCANAFYNRANTLIEMRQFAAAVASYDRAAAIDPQLRFLLGTRRHAQMNICEWSDLAADVERLTAGIEAGAAVSAPFPIVALLDSAPLQLKAAQIWVRERFPRQPVLGEIARHPARDRIRIGYFSADFHAHPVARLLAELIERHDRSRYEVTAFSFGPDTQDDMRQRMEKAFDRFIDVREQSDTKIALLSRSLGIDIAVDLGGHTANSRTAIFALRVAPLQINYLGYAGTMGADYMDYLIADRTTIPPAQRAHYTEKIVHLPACFLPHDSTRAIADTAYMRADLGLPHAGFVYCCFNNNYKITPAVFDDWMRILRRTDDSVLWLSQNSPLAADNLRREAARRGVGAERLIFADRMASLPEHLARHRAADLFLDTRPYNAHATAQDALWAGLPVLTLIGATFAGRVAASLLEAVELPELITTTAAQYEDVAVALAAEPRRLADIKQRLADHRRATPLFDTPSFTRHLEAAYGLIHARYQAGLPPDHIDVAPRA